MRVCEYAERAIRKVTMKNNYNRDVIKLAKENKNYPASLEFGKIYRVVADEKAAKHQMIRVVDESGEDYLYLQKSFVVIELPQLAEDAFMALA